MNYAKYENRHELAPVAGLFRLRGSQRDGVVLTEMAALRQVVLLPVSLLTK